MLGNRPNISEQENGDGINKGICDIKSNDEIEDSDCEILENTIPVVTLDTSVDDETSDHCAETNEDIDCTAESSDPNTIVSPESDYILQLHFKDDEKYTKLKTVIGQAIRSAMLQLKQPVDVTENDNIFSLTVRNVTTFNNDSSCFFIVDATPTEGQTPPSRADVPKYNSNSKSVIDNKTPKALESEDSYKRPRPAKLNTCFNCGGNHSIRDCVEKKDFSKIRENRLKFGSTKTDRYHVDADQRFGHFIPGEITDSLRQALGLHKKDIPLHVYRMRIFGYPPGWLENSIISNSGLSMFDADEENEKLNEQNGEDAQSKIEYDLKKIVSFPGFNVEPPLGTYDETYNLRVPPMQEHQSKEVMVKSLRGYSAKSHRTKILKHRSINAHEEVQDRLEITSADMDIEDCEDINGSEHPLPLENEMLPPPPPGCSPPSSPQNSIVSARAASPSLDELHEHQQRLLAALDDSTLSVSFNKASTAHTEDDSLIDDIMALDDTQGSNMVTFENNDPIDDLNTTQSCRNPTCTIGSACENCSAAVSHSPDAEIVLNKSIGMVFGTPLIKSSSPYSTLPIGSCWSAGVSDIMDFENLPDSTGKYQQMKNVIKKVRVVVKELNAEFD